MKHNWAQQLVFIDATDGNKASADFHTPCVGFIGMWKPRSWWKKAALLGVSCIEILQQWEHMGSGLWSMSAGQRGGECYTLAVNVEMGPVFHSHSSQMPLYSVPPPFIPPPPLSSSNK